jgi:stage V sporulation protein D (sporulation-specific penicillin-binding protein)
VNDTYDPGSIFKLITASSAIEERAVTMNTEYTCKGTYKVYDAKIKCWDYPNEHGRISVKDGVMYSCNPVMIQTAETMGLTKFYDYIEGYGMTEKTGVDLPGEAVPIVQNKDTAGPVGLATMAFGLGLSTTPIQMTTAISSAINGGDLYKPFVVEKISDNNGKTVEKQNKKLIRKVISEKTSDEMREIMQWVAEGFNTQVLIKGVKVGSKTATVQKLTEKGEYSKTDRISTEVVVAPMDKPKYLTYIQIDEINKNWVGTGACVGPYAKAIMQDTLKYLD